MRATDPAAQGLRRDVLTAEQALRGTPFAARTLVDLARSPPTDRGDALLSAEPRWLPRLLKPVTEVREGEAVTALLLTLNAFLLLAAYYLIKPVREALILVLASGAEYKSYMGGAIAIALLFAVPAYARVADRLPRLRLVVGVSLFFAFHLVVFFAASLNDSLRSNLGLVFFVWVGIFNMMVVAQFWAFANDVYSEEQGKRLFPLIALGASIGAATGSRIAAALIPAFGTFPMLLMAAVVLCGCALLFRIVDARERARRDRMAPKATGQNERVGSGGGAFRTVFSHRYLLFIALFSLVFSWVNTNGEYMLGRLVKAAASDALQRGELFAAAVGQYVGAAYGRFFFYVNLVGVLLQAFAVSRLVRWFDFGPTFFLLPAIALCDATAAAFLPVLWVVRAGKIAENATDYSINNTLRQMLWLPTTRDMKYKAKQAVDTFFVRMGDVSSAVLVGVGTTLAGWGVRQFALANVVLVLVWLATAAAIVWERHRMQTAPTTRPTPPNTVEALGEVPSCRA